MSEWELWRSSLNIPEKKAKCLYCGYEFSAEKVINQDLHAPDQMNELVRTNRFYQELADFNGQILAGKIDLKAAIDADLKIKEKYNDLVASSSMVITARAEHCPKCSNPVAVDLEVSTKTKPPSANVMTIDNLQKLPLPSRETIAKALRWLGGTVDQILQSLDFTQYEKTEAFIEKVKNLLETLPENRFKTEFRDFLVSYIEWVKKEKAGAWNRFYSGILALAKTELTPELKLTSSP